MQHLENSNHDHVMNTNKNQCSKELVQFCDRFSDDNESNSDQSNDDGISAYDPQKVGKFQTTLFLLMV